MARGLRDLGHTQRIAAPPGTELERRAHAEGFPSAPLSRLALRGCLKDVQVVHAHTAHAQNLAWLASAGLDVKRIVTRHVAFDPRHALLHRLKYTHTCDGIIAVSNAARDALVNAGVPAERIAIIPTGVIMPPLLTQQQRADARRAWNLQPDDFAVGHLGAFTHEKGQDVGTEAARLVAERLPGLRMILAGEGPLRASLPQPANVVMPGHIGDPSILLAALDLFIMPSRSEGWGLAALEAMAAGVPVIASNTGGLPEMIDPGETGWLIPPGDPSALAEAICTAASRREGLARMGALARTRAQRFSIEETARKTEEFYLRVLQAR